MKPFNQKLCDQIVDLLEISPLSKDQLSSKFPNDDLEDQLIYLQGNRSIILEQEIYKPANFVRPQQLKILISESLKDGPMTNRDLFKKIGGNRKIFEDQLTLLIWDAIVYEGNYGVYYLV